MNPPIYLINICYFALLFYTALLLSLIFTPLSVKIAHLIGVIDLPDERKVHLSPVPRLGGLGMASSILLALVMCLKFDSAMLQGYALGLTCIVVT